MRAASDERVASRTVLCDERWQREEAGAEEAKPNAEPPVSEARMRDMTLGHDNCPEEERESPHGSLV